MKDCIGALLLQIMEGSSSRGSMNTVIRLPNEEYDCLLPSSSSSSTSVHPHISMTPCHASQDIPLSWSQLLLGETYTAEENYGLATTLDRRKMDSCWEEQMVNPARADLIGFQQEFCGQVLPTSFSTTLSKNMLGFSNMMNNMYIPLPNRKSFECNSIRTGTAPKKARFQGSFSAQSTFKVRKEKIGDRITALHQLVSPFGKTDTASVLLEVIDYIRFLQSQIEALSLPYSSSAPGNMKHPHTGRSNNEGAKKDLKSRGLCLVPVSFILQV